MIIFTITLVSCREAWPYVAVFMLCSGLPRRCLPAYWKILSLSILGCLPLIKFSYGMVMLPCLILSGIALVVSEKKKSISKLVVGIVVIIVSFLLCWLACGQSPAYLLAYFKGSFEIARGFSGSMGSSLSSTEPLLDITLAGVTSVFMFAPLISNLVADCTKEYKLKAICRRLISDNGVFMLLMGLVYVFFCFKASFTRQDSSHTTQWMYILPVAVLLFVAMAGKFRHIPGKNLFYLCIVFFLIFFAMYTAIDSKRYRFPRRIILLPQLLYDNCQALLSPCSMQRQHEALCLAVDKSATMPELKKMVERSSVTIVGTPLIELLIRNGMNFKPTPVIQSYSAYTSYLQKLNASLFYRQDAPDIVIYKNSDKALIHGADIVAVMRRYRLISKVDIYDVYRTRPGKKVLEMKPLLKRNLKWGEKLDLSRYKNKRLVAKIKINYSFLGRLSTFLLRPPEIIMDFSVGKVTGKERIIPGLCSDGALINADSIAFRPGLYFSASIDQFKEKLASKCFKDRINIEVFELTD